MSDLISRQAAIDAVQKYKIEHGFEYHDCACEIENDIERLPSAQPKRTEERTETHACDCISRQAAIDALMVRDKELRNINWYDKPFAEGECRGIDEALAIVSNLPSAQSQPEEDCDTCKHGFFGSRQCDNCRVRYPSHYERDEEQHGSD